MIPRSAGRPATRNWSLQGQRGKGAAAPRARFATGRFADFFSAPGPVTFYARTYIKLARMLARERGAGPQPFTRKVSVTRLTINPQFSRPLPVLYPRSQFLRRRDSFDCTLWRTIHASDRDVRIALVKR